MSDQAKSNTFDQFDGYEEATLTAGPETTLWERVKLNARAAWRTDTLAGAAYAGAASSETDRVMRAFDAMPDSRSMFRYRDADGTVNTNDRASPFDPFGNPLPISIDGRGVLEQTAALTGAVAGMVGSPENLIGGGLGRWLLGRAGVTVGSTATIAAAGAIDGAAVNAVVDAGIQAVRIATGQQEEFSLAQLAGGTGGGALIGGALSRWTQRWDAGGETAIGDQIDADLRPAAPVAPDGPAVADPVAATPADGPVVAGDAEAAPAAPVVEEAPSPAVEAPADVSPTSGDPVASDAAPAAMPVLTPVRHANTVAEAAAVWKTLQGQELTNAATGMRAVINKRSVDKVYDFAQHLKSSSDADYLTAAANIQELFSAARLDASHPDRHRRPNIKQVHRFSAALDVDGRTLEAKITVLERVTPPRAKAELAPHLYSIEAIEVGRTRRGLPPEGSSQREPAEAGARSQPAGSGDDIAETAPAVKTADDPGNSGPLGRVDGGAASEAPPARVIATEAAGGGDELASSKGALRGEPRRADAGVASSGPVDSAELVRLHDLAAKLEEALELPAVRQGRFSIRGGKGGQVLGQYAPRTGVIRVRSIDDFGTLAHEAGHHLEVKIGKPLQALMRQHSDELTALDYVPNRPDATIGRKEGLAEYLRLAMTNPAYAAKVAPQFDAAFRKMMAAGGPDILKTIDEMAAGFTAWIAQPSRQAVLSGIVSGRKPGWIEASRKHLGKDWKAFGGTITDAMNRAYDFFVDDLGGLDRSVRALARTYQANSGLTLDLAAANDPYKLARAARGSATAATGELQYGVTGYRSLDWTSPGLRDAIILATGAKNALSAWRDDLVQQFGAYLWSRRAVGEWARYQRGEIPNPPDKFTLGDHLTNIAELEREFPAFGEAAPMVHQYAQALWQKKFDAGAITREQFEDGLRIADYVPGRRHFEADEAGGGSVGRDGKGETVRRFRGSTRDVINPLDSLMQETFQLEGWIARNDAVRALANLARLAGNGAGAIAEKIPVRELRAMHVDPIEAAEAAARAAGLGTADTVAIRDALSDMLGDAKATVFRPAIINEAGEPIVFYREGGELQALRLADGQLGRDMVAAFNQMTRGEQHLFTRLLAVPAAVLRTGITTSLEFIGANGIRDLFQSVILYGQPFRRVAGLVQGGADELLQRQAVRDYNAVGGIMGGAQTAGLRGMSVDRDLDKLRKKGWAAQRLTSFKGLLEATELSETATRVGLFRSFREEAAKRGLNAYETAFEAAFRARDYIDFDRRGWGMAGLARVIPFLNAALQGLDKVGRHMVQPLYRRGVLAEDARDLALATRSYAYLAMATVASVSLHAYGAQDWEYDEISDTTRATHWMIKWGDKFIAVPKPFEFAAAFNGASAIYDAWVRNEPGQAARFLEDLWEVTAPPSIMEGNPLVSTYFELQTGTNLFTGNPIVPDAVKGLEPHLQWTHKTSELSKWLGRQLGESPAVIDHLITSFGGSWGSNALALTDWATGAKGRPGWDDFAVTRRFIKDEARGSRSVGAFYERAGRTTGSMSMAAATYKEMASGDPREAVDYLARQDEATRIYVTAAMLEVEVRRSHPMFRARDAVGQINKVRRQIVLGKATTADGDVAIGHAERTAADDILADLAMAEARNALILIGAEGWKGKDLIDTSTYHRELQAASPGAYQALADRYATAKVRAFGDVAAAYGELRPRLLRDGTDALTADITALVKANGTELDGEKIGRPAAPAVPGLDLDP